MYTVLCDKGFYKREELNTLNKFKSHFIGHPTRKIRGIEHNTGALGHGLSVAAGMAIGLKLDKKPYKVFTLLGDGEISEGSIWEGIMSANKYKLDNLVIIIDRNRLQITGKTEDVNPIEPLKEKFLSFGLAVEEVDGNSIKDLQKIFKKIPFENNKPNLIIANTTKGSGISFIENEVVWHHKVPNETEFQDALKELEKQKLSFRND